MSEKKTHVFIIYNPVYCPENSKNLAFAIAGEYEKRVFLVMACMLPSKTALFKIDFETQRMTCVFCRDYICYTRRNTNNYSSIKNSNGGKQKAGTS